MDIDTPQGTDEGSAAPEVSIEDRLAAVLDPQEDTQAQEDVDRDEDPPEPEADAPEEEEAELEADDSEDTEEAEEESEDDEPEVPPTVKVLVDGQELELPVDEVAKGYQRQADYTRKTQEVAQQKQAMEQELAQSKTHYAQIIDQLGSFLEGQQVKAPDPSLAEDDPFAYTQQLAQYQEHKQRLDAVQAERERNRQEHQAQNQTRLQQHVAKEGEVLLEKIPEWKDAKVQKAETAKLKSFLREFGVSDQELSDPYSVFQTDHRAILLARDAMKYRQSQAKKAKAVSKSKGKPKVAKPGVSRGDDQSRDMRRERGRLAKSGSVDDAAAVLKHIL